jgi:hypothetical protein
MNIHPNPFGRMLAAGAAVTAGLLGLPGVAQAGLPAASALLTRAPYLTDLTQTSVRVNWATSRQYRGVVEYGPPGHCRAHSVTSARLGSPITVNGVREYQSSLALTGLAAGAGYCYRVTTGGAAPVDLLGSAASPQFATVPPAGSSQPLTFDVIDDWGDTTSGGVNDGSVNANQAAIDSEIASSGARFAVSIGDIAYQEGTQTNYGDLNQSGPYVSDVFAPPYWARPGQGIPVFQGDGDHGQTSTILGIWPQTTTAAASGGKDSMVYYPAAGGRAAGRYPTQYYAFSAGGARFYVLDAAWGDLNQGSATGGSCGIPCTGYQVDHAVHWTRSSPEYKWLAKDLAAHPGGLKFAFFHFPLYSDDSTEPTDRYLDNTPGSTGSLEQLLHDNGVDLAFTGHAHDYQRNIAVPGGVTSYVTGGGGGRVVPIRGHGCATTDAYGIGWSYLNGRGSACGAAPRPAADAQVYNFLKVTVDASTVTVTPTNAQGQAFDARAYDFGSDTTPPSAPGHLTAAPASGQTVLTWSAATDNIGVSAYDIFRNGRYLATVGPGVTSYPDSTARPGARYTYQVDARDLAGNTASVSARA